MVFASLLAELLRLWKRLWERFSPQLLVSNPEKDHVYVVQLRGNKKLSSHSPACIKLAHWLRMAGVPHTLISPVAARMGPTGKVPYVEFNGRVLGDSSHIIDRLESALGKDLDEGLSPVQRATALAVQRMLEEHLYFIMVHYRYQDDACFQRTCKIYTEGMGRWIPFMMKTVVRPGVIAQVEGQGIGRMTEEMIARRAHKDIGALSTILGDSKFLLGDRPCTADASVFGFLHCILNSGVESPVAKVVRNHKNLLDYVDRSLSIYWDSKAT